MQNLINLAAVKAAMRDLDGVDQKLLMEAMDDVGIGVERKGMVLSDSSKRRTAYHEGGHAICSLVRNSPKSVRKITIVPRGQSLGMVAQLPKDDEEVFTLDQAKAMLVVAMAGRAAECLIYGEMNATTGAFCGAMRGFRRVVLCVCVC